MPSSAHSSKDPSISDPGGCDPCLQFSSHPVWNRNRPNVPALTDQIHDGPVIFPLFKVSQTEIHGLFPPQSAGKKQRKESSIPFTFQDLCVWRLPE